MSTDLEGRVVVVTGAGRGIGRGIALGLARDGARLVVASRTEATVDEVVQEIRDAGGSAVGARCDASERADIADREDLRARWRLPPSSLAASG